MTAFRNSVFAFTLIGLVVLAAACATPTVAHDKASDTPADHYTTTLGIQGYSPVSYFTKGVAEPGSPLYPVTHEGVTYFVASPKQVALFEGDPEKYSPAYGGWCAFGAAVEDHFPTDPHSWKIVDGRLMFFLNNDEVDAKQLWNDDNEAELTKKADTFWANTHGG